MKTDHLLAITLLFSMTAFPAMILADDTDIYLANQGSFNRNQVPNVLIIFDTSGSMGANKLRALPTYDPSHDYTADDSADNNIIKDRIYWSLDGNPDNINYDRHFQQSNSYCRDTWIDSLEGTAPASVSVAEKEIINGLYVAPLAFFDTTTFSWKSFSNDIDPTVIQNSVVDCEADEDAINYPGNTNEYTNSESTSVATMYGDDTVKFPSWSDKLSVTLWSGNYLAYVTNSNLLQDRTRMAVAQDTIKSVIAANPTLRFGLMAFNTSTNSDANGGRIVDRVDTMNKARRTALATTIDSLVAEGSTPLAETLWEARLYFGGLDVEFGDADSSKLPPVDSAALTGIADGTIYKTPVTHKCQSSFVIYMTDGAPTEDEAAESSIENLTGSCDTESDLDTSKNSGKSCLNDLARWMSNNDVLAGSGTTEEGRQTVKTYTIGFGSGLSDGADALLKKTANDAGTRYMKTNSATGLATAFQTILADIQVRSATFVAPSVSINAFNSLFHRDEIYMAMFKPDSRAFWNGNVKKYKLCTREQAEANSCIFGEIIDKNNAAIIDASSGQIKDSATEFWSANADGGNVTKGGAGDVIPTSANRKIYTYTGTYDITDQRLPTAGNETDLSHNDNAVTDSNKRLTATHLNVNDASRTTVINWMRGIDSFDEDGDGDIKEDRNWRFSDILHSSPVVVSYGAENDLFGDPNPDEPIDKIVVGTNDGGLRLINAKTGVEEWTFIPQELLPMQNTLGVNDNVKHPYGLDNTVTIWTQDNNDDGTIEPAGTAPDGGDRITAYVSMRRGGRNIYALDITPTNKLTSDVSTDGIRPKLLWVIRGGSTPGYEKLGQTWSRPQIKTIRYGTGTGTENVARTVLIFGGGYDDSQDSGPFPSSTGDVMGNAIYIADAETGQRIWWASNTSGTDADQAQLELPKIDFSIPSDLALYDSNGDGAVNRIYVGDVAGQVWRIDLSPSLQQNNNGEVSIDGIVIVPGSKAYVFADVACTSGSRPQCSGTSIVDRRKFFYSPDVAQVTDLGNGVRANYDVVTLASGNRSDPLDLRTGKDPVHNGIYVLRDYNIETGPPLIAPSPITITDLVDLTAESTNLDALQTSLDGADGWFINLQQDANTWLGEKSLARTTIFGSDLLVTTYTPPGEITDGLGCDVNFGIGRTYSLNLLNGQATDDLDGLEGIERYITTGTTIPSEAVVIIRDDGTSDLVNTDMLGAVDQQVPRYQTYWYH